MPEVQICLPTGFKALSLTQVLYIRTSLLGHLLAYITLIPLALIVAYLTLILSRWRMAVWKYMFAGQLANEALNYLLKSYLQHPRPFPFHQSGGFGMPSSHAQFMAYFAAYSFLLFRLERIRIRRLHPSLHPILNTSVLGIAALVIYSRVHLQYHTVPQVLAGTVVGLLFGTLSFVITCPEFPLGPRPRSSKRHD